MKRALPGLVAVGCLLALPLMAAEWIVDLAHSRIGFAVRHMLLSNVNGHFKDFSVTITGDEADPLKASVKATIQVASIDTGITKRDEHLRGKDFFDAATHPEITFTSTSVRQEGDGYVISGKFTMRGVSREIQFPFQFQGKLTDPSGKTRAGFSARTELNRKDYGVSWSQKLDGGGLVVGETVKVDIELEMVRQ